MPWSTSSAGVPAEGSEGGAPIRAPRGPAIGPALPILVTIAWILLMVGVGFTALFSFFLFDSGVDAVSAWTWMVFFGVWGTLLLCPISIIASWIAWGLTRRRMRTGWGRVLRGTCYCLPLLGVLAVAIGFGASEILCNGSFTCS